MFARRSGRSQNELRRGLIRESLAIPEVRRAMLAFGALTMGEWVLGTAVAIHAYALGGALAVGLVGFRFVPAALVGMGTALLGEHYGRSFVLTATAGTRALAAAGVASALAAGAPFGIVVALVWLDACVGSAYRPAQAGLLPALVRTPGQLTAAGSLASNAKTSAQVLGAVTGGLLLATLSATTTVAVAIVLYLLAATLTAGVHVHVGGAASQTTLRSRLRHTVAGLSALRADKAAGRIAAWSCARSSMRGLWTALGVVASLGILGMGRSGFGELMAAAGIGALAAIPLTARLVGRSHLGRPLAAGLALCSVPIAVVGTAGGAAVALASMLAWGVGMSVSDVSAQALLNRVVRAHELPRVVALMESAKLLAEGVGSLLGPVLVAVLGIRGALLCAGGVPFALLLVDTWSFRRIDATAVGRVELFDLVRRVALFAPMRMDGLEGVVSQLVPEHVPSGTVVIAEGDAGSRWYLLAEGQVDVVVGGYAVLRIESGGSFGERALLRDQPRGATVRAVTDLSLLCLEREAFLSTVLSADIQGEALELRAPRDPRDALRRQQLLAHADRAMLDGLAAAASIHSVAAGSELFSAGQIDDRYFVLLDGEIEIHTAARILPLRPGDAFGEIAVIHRVPRAASAVARTAATVLAIPGEQLRAVLIGRGEG